MGTARPEGKVGRTEARVAGLFVYPVKACGALAPAAARLGERGLELDRRWMVVTPEGRMVTQRELAALARVRPTLGEGGALRLDLPDGGVVELPPGEGGADLRVRVWRDEVEALAPSPEADAALARCFGRPLRLARFPEAAVRPCDPAYAPPGSHTAFPDGFPLLVVSEASLDELNAALAARDRPPVAMARFRPNLVLAGVPARAEDGAARLRLGGDGGAELLLVKPCDRCVVTTVDQEAGRRTGAEPLATLARIRRNPRTGGVWFGQNAVPVLPPGGGATLEVGQVCELLPA